MDVIQHEGSIDAGARLKENSDKKIDVVFQRHKAECVELSYTK